MDDIDLIDYQRCKYCDNYKDGICQIYNEKKNKEHHCMNFFSYLTEEELKIKVKENKKENDIINLRSKYFLLKDQKHDDKANELLVEYIKSNNKVYSIRNDNKKEMWIYDNGIYGFTCGSRYGGRIRFSPRSKNCMGNSFIIGNFRRGNITYICLEVHNFIPGRGANIGFDKGCNGSCRRFINSQFLVCSIQGNGGRR